MVVDQPYNWDDYRSDFKPGLAYELQEAAFSSILPKVLTSLGVASVLEVGPGFGRITRLLLAAYPSPPATYALSDLSEAALIETSEAFPKVDFSLYVGPLQNARPFPRRVFDLVVAIEVLMHIPPDKVDRAVDHLLASVRPRTANHPGGVLITCDWTEALPLLSNGTEHPIRTSNHRHNYPRLFKESGATSGHTHTHTHAVNLLAIQPVGLQTLYAVSHA